MCAQKTSCVCCSNRHTRILYTAPSLAYPTKSHTGTTPSKFYIFQHPYICTRVPRSLTIKKKKVVTSRHVLNSLTLPHLSSVPFPFFSPPVICTTMTASSLAPRNHCHPSLTSKSLLHAFKKCPRPSSRQVATWLDTLPADLLHRLATCISSDDSSGQTPDALHLAETSPALKDAVLASLSHKLIMYYGINHADRWTAVFLSSIRTVILGDDYPGVFQPQLNPHPYQLLSAPTLHRAEVNREDTEALRRLSASESVRELVVRFNRGGPHTELLRALPDMKLTFLELHCYLRCAANCPFNESGRWYIRPIAITRRCTGLVHLRKCCVSEKHPNFVEGGK